MEGRNPHSYISHTGVALARSMRGGTGGRRPRGQRRPLRKEAGCKKRRPQSRRPWECPPPPPPPNGNGTLSERSLIRSDRAPPHLLSSPNESGAHLLRSRMVGGKKPEIAKSALHREAEA